MTARRLARMRATLDRRQPDLAVILDQVNKPHNLSAILRTCDAVGVFDAHAVWHSERIRVNRTASAGAGQWIRMHTHPGAADAIKAVQAGGARVYAAHLSERAVDFRAVDYTRPCAVLMGAELWGVSEAAAELADEHVIIPMAGLAASLNVSVAAAVILYEAQRQRADAGFYDAPRLDDDTYRRTLFEWMQPRMARRCREEGREYPPLDDEGHVVHAGGG